MTDDPIIMTVTFDRKILRDPVAGPAHLENQVYAVLSALFEAGGEYNVPGFLGNGHHAAQMLAAAVREEWARRATRASPAVG